MSYSGDSQRVRNNKRLGISIGGGTDQVAEFLVNMSLNFQAAIKLSTYASSTK